LVVLHRHCARCGGCKSHPARAPKRNCLRAGALLIRRRDQRARPSGDAYPTPRTARPRSPHLRQRLSEPLLGFFVAVLKEKASPTRRGKVLTVEDNPARSIVDCWSARTPLRRLQSPSQRAGDSRRAECSGDRLTHLFVQKHFQSSCSENATWAANSKL
jgi:hypothetical protein